METLRLTISAVISVFIFYFNLIFYHNPNNLEKDGQQRGKRRISEPAKKMIRNAEVRPVSTQFKEQNEI